MPLRLVFSAPPASAGSRTSTASLASASASINAREVRLPVSSSEVMSIATEPLDGGAVSNRARAASRPIATPVFMSSTPGPWSRPSRRTIGIAAICPRGQTVSTWPTSRTRGRPPPISSSV